MLKNLVEALKNIELETNTSDLRKACQYVVKSLDNQSIEFSEALNILAQHIVKFEDAVLFRKYLSNILLALVTCKIPLKSVFSQENFHNCNDTEKNNHLVYSVVLALLSDHPDILQYVLKYFEINPVPPYEIFIQHEDSYNVAPKKRRLQDCRQKVTEYHIVKCCHTLLSNLPNQFASKWDWTKFVSDFSQNENPEICWMVKECMAILTNMTEAQSKQLSSNLNLPNNGETAFTVHQGSTDINSHMETISDIDMSAANIVNIDGILLPIHDNDNVHNGNLVPVKSTINNLRSLALAVASGKAICLMGPVGSGKTSLVEQLAAITGRKGKAFKKVQLGDQTDSRMLLGTHQCTDVPGEFVWKPGVLTEAVQCGHWLLLEDIDCAALDVASTLSSLLERNTLSVPGYRDSLPVTPGFQLFVTQRVIVTNYGFQKKISSSSALLQKHLTQINVEPLSRTELAEIIQTLYPSLTTICSRMIEVFMMFSFGSHDSSLQSTETFQESTDVILMRGSRLISTRDLMKWCARAVVDFDVTSPESALKVLQDAIDIFTCSVVSPENRFELAKKVGTCLGIVETKSEFYCKHYKPNVILNLSTLEVGRAKVFRKEQSLESIDFDMKQVVFSFTRQSACLLERIACCVMSNEPVLLVGETGTGKTSSVQYIARQTGHKLIVINMNQQSDSADLLGGYKPVDLKYVIRPIRNEFEELFKSFYNLEKNKKFLHHIDTCYETENWTALLALMKQSCKAAISRVSKENKGTLLSRWKFFGNKLVRIEQQIKAASRLTFAFIEGSLVKAMQEGHWVLLDEINLASAEILECLAGLLEDKNESIDLLEKGDKVPIKRHQDFVLFACMNPATDVGKKDLPVGLRNRFTEFFIDELVDRNDLMLLVGDYLYHLNLSGSVLEAIYSFYSNIRKEAKLSLVDGAGNAPHYSLRTLCRALTAAAKAKCGTVSRSLYEAFCLSFLTQLDSVSHPKVEAMIAKAVIGKKNLKSVLNQLIPEPQVQGQQYLLFEGHWIPQGKLDIVIPDGYILTATVRKNLRDIARIISLGRLPVLLQGDTSVGKTSLITYIAKSSGNYCMRINNHEHTDLQEYIGSYATDANGKLVFKEGVLVEAMRKGYWIILDELNLAPSDVLEALNRVLDDNRELYIPETQQVVKADPNFMLFATQNPPGLYGGRKMLSRAFRNRFVELHFDEIPRSELEIILHQRCHIPPTYSKKMIAVMAELQVRRRGSAAVQGKDGFITLRDLFRWGQRYKLVSKDILTDDKFYDWDQHIADEGYLILAGKVRQPDERHVIQEVIEKHIKRRVDPDNLFSLHTATSPVTKSILEKVLNNTLTEFNHVVWTYNMRRLAVLITKAFTFQEPVLLVGETGCGKTTICQVLATLRNNKLISVNCHMHTESADFLGGLRPVRQYKDDGKLFEWVDGPLIKAMEHGSIFLADEISLADDSVLERLNSLLEPERQLVLAERGTEGGADILVISAETSFHFIGTMNPGGDFGKKELSPALRNRFTEIWCDSVTSRQDLLDVLEKSVNKGISLGNQEDGSSGIGNSIIDFTNWLKNSEVTNKFPFSVRDLLSWVNFLNSTVTNGLLDVPEAYVHGACMTFLDCFGTALTGHVDADTLFLLRKSAINFLLNQIKFCGNEFRTSLEHMLSNKQSNFVAESDGSTFGIKPFYIKVGSNFNGVIDEHAFTFNAPTTGVNTLRLLRGLQLNKAILLEGNPGVGKTSLVTALAKASGHKVVRMNLSDQTDVTDLFGTDLPSEDGSFAFKESSFLRALQNGDWILLDELNLAPQPVLEGLNACLDHRGEVYIPELGTTFKLHSETRIFACQNPLKQGGARRGLPISFLNRFTQVYIDTLTQDDLIFIVESQYPTISKDILHKIVKFNCRVAHEISVLQAWGHKGSPWEMNLRDIQRWCDALISDQKSGKTISPGKFVDILYVNRMRTSEDKGKIAAIYDEVFHPEYPRSDSTPQFYLNENEIIFGDITLERNEEKKFTNRRLLESNLLILRNQLPALKALAQCIKMNWLSIIVGSAATGKSSVVQVLADLTGNELQVVPVTSAMDVSDLLGGFEQIDYNRNLENLYDKIETLTIQTVRNLWLKERKENWKKNKLLNQLYEYKSLQCNINYKNVSSADIQKFNERVDYLIRHCVKLLDCYNNDDITHIKLMEIKTNLIKLKAKVDKISNVNAGGKFEWVDSLFVKTMIDGSWLVLDNVNLTSAAVLDRLNGLLEPNGTLSIPERGDINNIVPHPNFKIFFTMDPKYGDISRAMRNRGVEIFILRPDESNVDISAIIPHMDLFALLKSCGLSSEYHILCVEAHSLMNTYIQGLERPTIGSLLQAAYLMWQQIVRGIPYKVATVSSFSDVYIKPRCGGDFSSTVNMSLAEMKNIMWNSLQKLVQDHQLNRPVSTNHTVSVAALCKQSAYEITKQLSYPLLQQMASDEKYSSLYLFNICIAYDKCLNENQQILYNIIKEEVKDNSIKKFVNKLNDFAFETASKNEETFKRYFPESYNLKNNEILSANNKYLLLYNNLLNTYINFHIERDNFSAFDYSKAVLARKITDDFVEHPILKYCQYYLQIVDEYINHVLQCDEAVKSDQVSCTIVQLLNWRSRFIKICTTPMFVTTKNKRTPILKEEIVPLMYMHCKWLQKYLMDALFELLPPNHKLIVNFKRAMKKLLFCTDENSNALNKLNKKIRKLYGQPKLHANEDEHLLCLSNAELHLKLRIDLQQPLMKQKEKFTISNITNYSLALDIPENDAITYLQQIVSKTYSSKSDDINVASEIKLLPINDYIILRVINLLQNYFLEVVTKIQLIISKDEKDVTFTLNDNLHNCGKLLRYLTDFAKCTKGFPQEFINLLDLLHKLQDPFYKSLLQKASSFSVRFWNAFYRELTNSPARNPDLFLFMNTATTVDLMEENIRIERKFSTNIPLLPYFVQKLAFVNDDSETKMACMVYETVPLKDRSIYSNQLDMLLKILWKNIGTLDCSASLKLRSDGVFYIRKYEELMNYLHFALTSIEDTANVYSNEITDKVLSCLDNTLYDEDRLFIDLVIAAHDAYTELNTIISCNVLNETDKIKSKILTGKLSLFSGLIFVKVMTEVSPVDEVEKHRLKSSYIFEDLKMFDNLLSSYYIQGVVSGTIPNSHKCEKASDVLEIYYDDENSNREHLKRVHPFCTEFLQLKQKTKDKISKYTCGNMYRPSEPPYLRFAKDCKHFRKSVLSTKATFEFAKNLVKTCEDLLSNIQKSQPNPGLIKNSQTIVKECSSWLYSVNVFYHQIEKDYSEAFPDYAKPLLNSLSQIVFTVSNLSDMIKELMVKFEQGSKLNEVITDLMVYPNNISLYDQKDKYLNRFVTSDFIGFVNKKRTTDNDIANSVVSELEVLELLKMNLSELKMHCMVFEEIDNSSIKAIETTLSAIVKTWEKQQREIEKKKDDDDALYVTKSKCEDIDEDQEANEEIIEMFPSYSDTDFIEFKNSSLEQKVVSSNVQRDNKGRWVHVINQEYVSLVYKWHSNIVRNLTSAEWLTQQKKLPQVDYVNPLLQRYPIFNRVILNAWEALDLDIEGKITPSLLLLISEIKAKVNGKDVQGQKLDFYRSPWISETVQCIPLLEQVKESTNKLLDQWPDFPTLKDILIIVNRILVFPVTGPVARFLTGLELLRDKIEEWNKNAHKGNNMIDVSLAVGQQIINWRKLEMAHWKECLNNLYSRKQSEAHKYWFYLYNVVHSYLNADPNDDAAGPPSQMERVTRVLREFMEKSNLVEYEVRLDIIFTYHLHMVHMDKCVKRDELLSILWNVYIYYAQFSTQVAAHIKEKRAPIEKKLRDFVKICSWDRDLSYWSVKDTVEKAHKTLHKHTKEFEKMLIESVSSCLVIDNSMEVGTDHVGIWDRPKRAAATSNALTGGAYLIDTQNHVVQIRNIKKHLDQAETPLDNISESSLLQKISSLFNKAKVLCKETISSTNYPTLVQGLDDFVTQIIETSLHLGSLEVDSSAEKAKQTSQAKSILQQKRKALADLYRYLTRMGLNYRTGLVLLNASDNDLYDFTLPPVDLNASMSYLKNKRCDSTLSLLWSGCEKYFQKNIARHKYLATSLLTPHQDLGLQNIDRIKGFSAILLKMTNTQKKSISKYSRYLCDLRYVASNFTAALDINDGSDTNIILINDKINILAECYCNGAIVLEQFCVLLKSFPENEISLQCEPAFDSVLSNSPIVKCYKNSEEWKQLYDNVKSILTIVNKQKTALYKLKNSLPKVLGKDIKQITISQIHIDVTNEARGQLQFISNEIQNLILKYQFNFESTSVDKYVPNHPILRSITSLSAYIEGISIKIDELNKINLEPMDDGEDFVAHFANQSEDLIATMLLIIQSLYKKHLLKTKDEEGDVLNAIDEMIAETNEKELEKEESTEILEENHLKTQLQEKLSSDIKMLQLDALIEKTHNVITSYTQYIERVPEINRVAVRVVPVLEQLVLFVQYFLTQQVAVHRVSCKMLSVLLKIFTDLSTKGFCKPADIDMEDGEGENGPGQMSGGTGLGEGEGQTDVSDKIENQDQLDDARRPGDEKKEEERDCKEEEKGINMTDDFDSHLQDVDKKGENDSEQDDDEDDADKQMGETDNAAEKLDQQIWGSEDEDIDEEQNDKKDKEDKGTGESTGEKEMAAKEEEQGADDGTEGKDKKKKKDINEMEEPEIDDDHVDPYHGNQQPLPEPEDFELPENMDLDGNDNGDENDGETETENPFEIDVMKENIPEDKQVDEEENKKEQSKDDNLQLSSDDEDEGNENQQENQDGNPEGQNENEADKDENEEEADATEFAQDNPEDEDNETSKEKEEENEETVRNPDKIDEKDEIENKEDPKRDANPEANPSNDDPSQDDKAENAEMEHGTDDNVQMNPDQKKDEDTAPYEQAQEQVGDEKQATGRSELDQSEKGHRGERERAQRAKNTTSQEQKQNRRENKPGRTEQERTLGEVNEKKQNKTHTLNVENDEDAMDEGGDDNPDEEKDADAYQHVKQARKDDIQTIDAATKEQADLQPTLQEDEENPEDMKPEEIPMEVDEDDIQVEKAEELKPEKTKGDSEKDEKKEGAKTDGGDERTGDTGVEVEGDVVLTERVPRGADTTYHTRIDDGAHALEDMSVEQYIRLREWGAAGARGAAGAGAGAAGAWRALWHGAAARARALSERLRLVLEPTGRSRLAGDFRTGRRINMRRVIPYIASHFRKDRIWLRRTKPAKREYKIAVAVDDSSSMSDNRSKELAFESLALVSQALNLLESGELAVLSFGEQPSVLHSFSEQFSEHSGAKILENLLFNQTKTKIAQLLDYCTVLFEEQAVRSDAVNAKLLVVVSDGRGIFSEGETKVIQAVRRARQQGIFLVYVIIDNPDNKDSIMDIRRPHFDPVTNNLTGFISYLDTFPFPFYIILRDISALPTVLGDALRQWFELAANNAN